MQGEGQVRADRHCHKSYVYLCSSVWWSMNDHRHMQTMTHTHTCVVQTAVYHTTSPETRTGSAFTVPLSSFLAPCNISALATLPKQLWETAFTHRRYFFDWLNFVFQCLRVCVCGCVGLSLTFHPVLWCKPPLSLACWPALAIHPCIIISPCFLFLSFLCKIEFFL